MSENLKKAAKSLTKKSSSHTISMTTEKEVTKEPPAGATIIRKSVRTETEKIENGWLVTKNFDIKYSVGKDGHDYAYYSKKWFSETDPVKITVETTDKALADEFDDD